jgi:hypothetical protein
MFSMSYGLITITRYTITDNSHNNALISSTHEPQFVHRVFNRLLNAAMLTKSITEHHSGQTSK